MDKKFAVQKLGKALATQDADEARQLLYDARYHLIEASRRPNARRAAKATQERAAKADERRSYTLQLAIAERKRRPTATVASVAKTVRDRMTEEGKFKPYGLRSIEELVSPRKGA